MTKVTKLQALWTAAVNDVRFLVCGLLALRALIHPYSGFRHDALLYSVQVANRANAGAYQDDLFFRFGSQDSFSVFSRLISPLASLMSVEIAFWVCYWLFTALLVFAEIRIVKRLVPHPVAALLTLVFLAVGTLPFAGRRIFNVHEDFFTARLVAQALILLGLDQFLRDRRWTALGLAVLAMAMHPLMAVGGLALFVGLAACQLLPGRWFIAMALACGLAASCVLLIPSLTVSVLGHCDRIWFSTGYLVSRHCFVTQWWWQDWVRIAVALWVTLAARRLLPTRQAELCLMVCVLAIGSLAVTLLAESTGYLLLLQGQAYRSLWLLQLLAIPLTTRWVMHLFAQPAVERHLLGVALLGYWLEIIPAGILDSSNLAAAGMVFVGIWCSGLIMAERTRWSGYRVSIATAAALFAVALVWSMQNAIGLHRYLAVVPRDPLQGWNNLFQLTSTVLWAALSLALLTVARAWLKAGTMSAVWVALIVATFFVQNSQSFRQRFETDYASLMFVRDWIEQQNDAPSDQTVQAQVYWPGEPDRIWIELQQNSYYSWPQLQGLLFSRELTMEALRRRQLVGRFEIANMRRLSQSIGRAERHREFLTLDEDAPKPDRADLVALAQDEQLDWIILPEPIGRLHVATDGLVYIYDAARLRNSVSKEQKLSQNVH